MSSSRSTASTMFSHIVDAASSVYVLVLEPVLTVAYVWLMWRIGRSRIKELHSSFYSFFILTGIAACLNELVSISKIPCERYIPNSWIKDIVLNFALFGSYSFSMSHAIGKVLVVATRFTVICYPLYRGDMWTPRTVGMSAALMFTIPPLFNCFVLPMDAKYRIDANGNTVYLGVAANWAMQTTRYIAVTGCILFLILTTPMCAACMFKLRQFQQFNKSLAKQEKSLLIHTVITTIVHTIKSAQQIFVLVSIVMSDAALFDLAMNMYTIPNILTTFVSPLLLVITSTPVRQELSFGLMCRRRELNVVASRDNHSPI